MALTFNLYQTMNPQKRKLSSVGVVVENRFEVRIKNNNSKLISGVHTVQIQ